MGLVSVTGGELHRCCEGAATDSMCVRAPAGPSLYCGCIYLSIRGFIPILSQGQPVFRRN